MKKKMKLKFGRGIRKLIKRKLRKNKIKLFSLILCLAMLATLLAGCNKSPVGDETLNTNSPESSDKAQESTDTTAALTTALTTEAATEDPKNEHLITFYADVNWDGVKDHIVVDPIAAADASAEQKTVWVIDPTNKEEIWSTTLGAGNGQKGGVYLKLNEDSSGEANIYFWQTYMLDEKTLYAGGYFVFSRDNEGKVGANPMDGVSRTIDISSDRSISRGKPQFLYALSDIGSKISYGNTIALLDNSREELIYSTPEMSVKSSQVSSDLENGKVYSVS